MTEEIKTRILDELEPMFRKAEAEGLYFHCGYQDLWFSPAELRQAHAEGRFVWGAVNWTLRDPEERTRQLRSQVERSIKELKHWEAR